jgi:hypothetical protein
MVTSQRRGRSREKERVDLAQAKGSATKELGGAQERLLSEPPISVTDHTTRTLEPVYRKRNTE